MNGPHEGLDDLTPVECMAGGFWAGARFAAHVGSDPEGILEVELPAYFQELERAEEPGRAELGDALLRVAAWAKNVSAPTSNRDPQTAEGRPPLTAESGNGNGGGREEADAATPEWAVKTLRETDPEDPVVQTLRFYLDFYRHGYIAALKSRPGPRSTIHALEQVESEEHWTVALELIERVGREHVNFINVCEHSLMLAANRYRPHLNVLEGGESSRQRSIPPGRASAAGTAASAIASYGGRSAA